MNIIFNPTLVKLEDATDEFNRVLKVAKTLDSKMEMAKFVFEPVPPNFYISMLDVKTKITWTVSFEKNDIPDMDYILEIMLNKANLTHIKPLDKNESTPSN